jgi:hypothetical protein
MPPAIAAVSGPAARGRMTRRWRGCRRFRLTGPAERSINYSECAVARVATVGLTGTGVRYGRAVRVHAWPGSGCPRRGTPRQLPRRRPGQRRRRSHCRHQPSLPLPHHRQADRSIRLPDPAVSNRANRRIGAGAGAITRVLPSRFIIGLTANIEPRLGRILVRRRRGGTHTHTHVQEGGREGGREGLREGGREGGPITSLCFRGSSTRVFLMNLSSPAAGRAAGG